MCKNEAKCVRIIFLNSFNRIDSKEIHVLFPSSESLFEIVVIFRFTTFIKDKSKVCVIVDYSRDYTVVNGV